LIGTISDVVYKDLEIDENVAGLISELICSQMYSRLYDLYNQYYLDEELKMSIDDVDKVPINVIKRPCIKFTSRSIRGLIYSSV